ncbi:uncharacterized protein LOC125607017 [Brassica napus]|uniref:uncharacterized protein LOC125607017 n=1 Tax=Brassica napus TaxID=3708 RepID=UPI0020787100|nr:uncharacterized protein LOC125607017 [Brassica napus]
MDTCGALVKSLSLSLSLAQNASASLSPSLLRNRVSPPLLVDSAGVSRFLTDRLESSASVSVESSSLSVVSPIVSSLSAEDASLQLSFTTPPLFLHISSVTPSVSLGGSISLSTMVRMKRTSMVITDQDTSRFDYNGNKGAVGASLLCHEAVEPKRSRGCCVK